MWADSTWAPAGAPGATLPLKSHFTAALPQGQPSALGEGPGTQAPMGPGLPEVAPARPDAWTCAGKG